LLDSHGARRLYRGRRRRDQDESLPFDIQLLSFPRREALDAFLADDRRKRLLAFYGDVFTCRQLSGWAGTFVETVVQPIVLKYGAGIPVGDPRAVFGRRPRRRCRLIARPLQRPRQAEVAKRARSKRGSRWKAVGPRLSPPAAGGGGGRVRSPAGPAAPPGSPWRRRRDRGFR